MSAPYYVIAAAPVESTRIRGFFREGGDSPGWLLTNPPVFRHAGFDVSTGALAHLVDGDRWEIQSRDRKVLQLFQDGTLIFRMRADFDFLGWGQEPARFAGLPALNPVAIVESHLSFVTLYRAIIERFGVASSSFVFTLRFHAAMVGGRRLAVTKYFERGIRLVVDPTLFPINDPNATAGIEVTRNRLTSRPDAVAYDLLVKCYDMFDAPPDLIPFADADGEPAIDVDKIIPLGNH